MRTLPVDNSLADELSEIKERYSRSKQEQMSTYDPREVTGSAYPVKTREATKAEIPAIARIHKRQFSDHLLGQLPVGILGKFYTSFCGKATLLVSECEGVAISFFLGGNRDLLIDIKKRFIRKYRILIAAQVIVRPKLYFPIFHSYKHLIDDGVDSDILRSRMRLLSTTILEDFKGTGAAEKLIGAF